jgi:hypothetical protein
MRRGSLEGSDTGSRRASSGCFQQCTTGTEVPLGSSVLADQEWAWMVMNEAVMWSTTQAATVRKNRLGQAVLTYRELTFYSDCIQGHLAVNERQGSVLDKEQCWGGGETYWLALKRTDSGLVSEEQCGGVLTRAEGWSNSCEVTFP